MATTFSNLLDMVYPLGSIWMRRYIKTVSATDSNPSTILGGNWGHITGKFLLAENPNSAASYGFGKTGGSTDVKLTIDQIPQHTHRLNIGWGDNNEKWNVLYAATGVGSSWGSNEPYYDGTKLMGSDGAVHNGGGAHSNMPPFEAVGVWARTQ